MAEKEDFKILITVNLQKDFFEPRIRHKDSISTESAFRLLGNDLACGPLGMFLNFINNTVSEKLVDVVHLKTVSERNKNYDTNLIFTLEDEVKNKANQHIIQIGSYNPFFESGLEKYILDKITKYGKEHLKIGVVGVNCESTMLFLIYELFTRFKLKSFATCRHLTAAKTTLQMDSVLLQLKELFDVLVFSSVTKFQSSFYYSDDLNIYQKSSLKLYNWKYKYTTPLVSSVPDTVFDKVSSLKQDVTVTGGRPLSSVEEEIVRYLYRGCSEFHLSPLTGGFGPCLVFRVRSKDWYGQEMASTVLKMGTLRTVAREKANFERVSGVLGTSAPAIIDYIEMDDKAAIKFMFASMSPDEEVNSFMKVYTKNKPQKTVNRIIEVTFDEILMRFYKAAERVEIDLFKNYNFDGKGWNYRAGGTDTPHLIRERIKKLIGVDPNLPVLEFSKDVKFRNVADFMEKDLPEMKKKFLKVKPFSYRSFVHGDMNGRNILLDGNNNVWLIDFEYTYQDHILKDTTKLEVDVLFEYTHVEDEKELAQAFIITKELLKVHDLGLPLKEKLDGLTIPKFVRAWDTVRRLRESTRRIAMNDRSTLQLNIVMLRYSLFLMTLPAIKHYNRVWALASACGHAEMIVERMNKNKELYINWVPAEALYSKDDREMGKLGITILPGLRETGCEEDLTKFREEGVDVIIMLISNEERMRHCVVSKKKEEEEEGEEEEEEEDSEEEVGVLKQHKIKGKKRIVKEMSKKLGMEYLFFTVVDQNVPSLEVGKEIVQEKIVKFLERKKNVVLISRSGLGRPGCIASCVLLEVSHLKNKKEKILGPSQAMDIVRSVRGPRAIETEIQKRFVERYYQSLQEK